MSPQNKRNKTKLRALARACGVAVSYLDFRDERVDAPESTIIALINALQHEGKVSSESSERELEVIRHKVKEARRKNALPPVIVAWDGRLNALWMWVGKDASQMELTLAGEKGAPVTRTIDIDDEKAIMRGHRKRVRIDWPGQIPFGYHRLEVDGHESFLISAPAKIRDKQRDWGLFAPCYALRYQYNQSMGGYRALSEAACFTGKHGGAYFGTLPMLATYYEGEQKNVSPYSPVSRLFWNEIFLDTEQENKDLEACRKNELVDYETVYRLKKPLLMEEADAFFAAGKDREPGFQDYVANTPYLAEYADFRADILPEEEREREKQFHLYVQYMCHHHLTMIKKSAATGRCAALYLDYPVGLHSRGFDAVHLSHLFLQNFSVGAPPDLFYSGGQDWGFHPYDPRALEEDRFDYFRATLHAHFRYARMLRLDHIMGFQRIFCIPKGGGADQGTYIYYPFDAFLAIMCLEAHRHKGTLVGEDLGTVPEIVRTKMEAHNINRMWVLPFEMESSSEETFAAIPSSVLACLNTHDLFPFEAFLEGKDMEQLLSFDLIAPEQAEEIRKEREEILRSWRSKSEDGEEAAFLHIIESLAASSAQHVLINIEDIWHETRPQNIPGLVEEYPNWRRKIARPVETWEQDAQMQAALKRLNRNKQTQRRHYA